jgi:hypothetical protein
MSALHLQPYGWPCSFAFRVPPALAALVVAWPAPPAVDLQCLATRRGAQIGTLSRTGPRTPKHSRTMTCYPVDNRSLPEVVPAAGPAVLCYPSNE